MSFGSAQDDKRIDYFVDVILPLALPNLYTYRVPQAFNGAVDVGYRVIVQFGKNKLYSAIVARLHTEVPKYTAKFLEGVLDDHAEVTGTQLKFWDWMSQYYMCTRGEVLLAAVPVGLRLSSETKIVLSPTWDGMRDHFDDETHALVEAIEVRGVLNLDEISEVLGRKTIMPLVRKLMDADVLAVFEEIKERYRPKFETFIRLADEYHDEEKLKELFAVLEKRAFRQVETLLAYLHLTGKYTGTETPVSRAALIKACKDETSGITGLIKRGALVQEEIEVSRLDRRTSKQTDAVLSDHQSKAYDAITGHFADKNVVLLHGVTSSGKTEIYTKLIREQIQNSKQVLYLLPEIALTTQLIGRLRKHFGESVLIYHSRFNEEERVEVWREVRKGQPCIVIGARSAVFLPYQNLGMVIIDEEHDPSFKQMDPAPRYNARESAIWLAKLHNAKTLLGSATPSVESFYNAKHNLYGFAELHERFGGAMLPQITITDVKEATKKKIMKSHFSPLLVEKINEALANKEQIILFQNRRGFAPSIECQSCGHVPHCVRCDVSLTYHKHSNQLKCHICGYTSDLPSQCEACGTTDLKLKGFGTEKIEEEIGIIFPEAKVARMDLDTTRGKFSLQNIITDFETGKTNILVGTQMVTKGLDFGNVALVGILSADQVLNYPDFRAHERAYQLMAQVAGRAGRREKQGEVIVQTFNPHHFIIECVVKNDYYAVYHNELADRMQFHYPPFHRLVRITIRGKDATLVDMGAQHLAQQLKQSLAHRILGPEYPIVARIRDEFYKNILVKLEREGNSGKMKEVIARYITEFKAHADFKKLRVVIDVDPN
jgi:primosomal protein N' (replication factor Y)